MTADSRQFRIARQPFSPPPRDNADSFNRSFPRDLGVPPNKSGGINVAIQENLPNAFAFVTRSMETLLLRKPDRRIRRSNSEDLWDSSLLPCQFF
jgi:hypothetical protein